MPKLVRSAALAALSTMMPFPAAAQSQMDAKAAAAAFGARERIIDASLSPDGTKVAIVAPGPGQSTVLQVLDLKANTSKPINYANGDPMTLSGCGWASNSRLACYLYGVTDENYGRYLPYSRLIAMDADGGNLTRLGAYERVQQYVSLSDGAILDWRDGTTSSVLIARNYVPAKNLGLSGVTSTAQGLGVDLLDTRTAKADHVESPNVGALRYITDGKGKVRIMQTDESYRAGNASRGLATFSYRLAGSNDWKRFGTYNEVTQQGLYPVAVDGGTNVAYALQKQDGRDALFRVALDGSLKQELAFAHPKVDIGGLRTVGRSGHVIGATYSTERPEISYFDPAYAELAGKLAKALPKLPLIQIVDSSADEAVHLVHAASDVDPGRYFLFDTKAKKLAPIGQDRPELAGIPLGAMKPVTYKTADGTEVPAYLTLPPGNAGKKLPTIVMPHGGPAARDEWGFDWLVQFFVARGYAFLQPNYRGSTGYGEGWFKENGFRSWKTAIGDVNDAGRWLIDQRIADPARLAIVGWSYGGYAALQSSVLDAKLFKAIVAIAPVTDLNMLRGQYTGQKVARDYIGEGPQLIEGSPLRHPEVFQAPVLLFHGTKDINVGVEESRAMDKALKKAGKKSELIIYPAIDHQLRDSAVRTDMLTKADAFLAKALN